MGRGVGKGRKRKRRASVGAWLAPRRWLPSARTRRRWWRLWRTSPPLVRAASCAAVVAVAWLAVNWVYQVYRKPSELFFPLSGALYKRPADTWRAYGRLFERHSTTVMTPALLAALAQVEGSGNPVVRTYWRWAARVEPFEIYRPASSAVGMYQITDGTFAAARRYCVHDHAVVTDGPWYALRSCWFNELYTRTIPSHAIELTAAYLDVRVRETLARVPTVKATPRDRQRLAALIHLCGTGPAVAFAARGFAPTPGQRCGAHDVRAYLARVDAMREVFDKLDAAG